MQHKKLKVGIIFVLSLYLFIGSLYLNKVYGYTDVLDRPIEELNGLTLNEVFEDGQLVTNGDFELGTIEWTTFGASQSVSNGINTFLASQVSGGIRTTITVILNDNYYFVSRLQTTANADEISIGFAGLNTETNIQSVDYQIMSAVWTSTLGGSTSLRINDRRTSNWDNNLVDYVYLFNLTALGIDNLTVEQMDNFYNQYNFYKDTQSVTYDGLGNKIINIIREFGNTIKDLYNYLMNTSYNVLGYEISFLALITGGILMVLLGLQVVWLFI